MGCSASRPNTSIITETVQNPSSSSPLSHASVKVTRTFSFPAPVVHHPPICEGDSQHLVSLTSTTYGSLRLINPTNPNMDGEDYLDYSPSPPKITRLTSKTLTAPDTKESPHSPDSVINTWELMDGLDDFDSSTDSSAKPSKLIYDLPTESPKKPNSIQHVYHNGYVKKLGGSLESVKSSNFPNKASSKPLWKHLSEESLLSKMDPNVTSSYRQALSSKQLGYRKHSKTISPMVCSPMCSPLTNDQCHLRGTEDRIVLYCTSLRGIRRTYEDCYSVQMIFRGFQVTVDERDVSMHSAYRKELEGALGGKMLSLPQVFIRGKYVGGADVIRQLNEAGELAKLLKGFPFRDPKFVCERCGDARFVPCPNCNGSHKVFGEDERQLRRCKECNENGLVRCARCCYS